MTASVTARASAVAVTSWARMIAAPLSTASAVAAIVPWSRSAGPTSPIASPTKSFREIASEHGVTGLGETAEVARRPRRMVGVLAEVRRRVDDDPGRVDSGGLGDRGQGHHTAQGLVDDVGGGEAVAAAVGVGARGQTPGVRADEADVEAGRDLGDERIRTGPRVVEQAGTGGADRLGDLMAPRVDADEEVRTAPDHSLDDGDDAFDLLGNGDLPTPPRTDPADVDDPGTRLGGGVDGPQRRLEGRGGLVERIGRPVDHSHDHRGPGAGVGEREPRRAGLGAVLHCSGPVPSTGASGIVPGGPIVATTSSMSSVRVKRSRSFGEIVPSPIRVLAIQSTSPRQ